MIPPAAGKRGTAMARDDRVVVRAWARAWLPTVVRELRRQCRCKNTKHPKTRHPGFRTPEALLPRRAEARARTGTSAGRQEARFLRVHLLFQFSFSYAGGKRDQVL